MTIEAKAHMTTAHHTNADTIVREHGYRIRRLLGTFATLTPAERDDLFQRVSLKLVEKASTFEGRSQVTTWLHRVVVNEVLMLVRSATRRREVGGHDERALEAAHPGRERSPESHLERAERLHTSMQGISAADRDLLTRHYVDGIPMRELAASIGIGEDALKTRIHRARHKARAAYTGGNPRLR